MKCIHPLTRPLGFRRGTPIPVPDHSTRTNRFRANQQPYDRILEGCAGGWYDRSVHSVDNPNDPFASNPPGRTLKITLGVGSRGHGQKILGIFSGRPGLDLGKIGRPSR